MAFSLPPVKVKPELPNHFEADEGEYGVAEMMKHGLTDERHSAEPTNELLVSETNYFKNCEKMNMTILRNIQGLHAPLRLAMEKKFASKVGRLPFLPSSNVMLDSLTGRDIEMHFEDVFNLPEFCETPETPHDLVEKSSLF